MWMASAQRQQSESEQSVHQSRAVRASHSSHAESVCSLSAVSLATIAVTSRSVEASGNVVRIHNGTTSSSLSTASISCGVSCSCSSSCGNDALITSSTLAGEGGGDATSKHEDSMLSLLASTPHGYSWTTTPYSTM